VQINKQIHNNLIHAKNFSLPKLSLILPENKTSQTSDIMPPLFKIKPDPQLTVSKNYAQINKKNFMSEQVSLPNILCIPAKK